MPITSDGWLDFATRLPGPSEKVYSQPNAAMGYVPHSAVGFYGGWASRLWDMSRDPETGRFTGYAAASVHGWISYNGEVIQHYPFTASCWASGNFHANTNFVAFENEGGFAPHNEPLTPEQVATNVLIIRELSEWRGWAPRRPASARDTTATLYEHNECVTLWGGDVTACPSSRIPWDTVTRMLRPPPPEEENEEMKVYLAWDRERKRVYLVGPWGASWITNRTDVQKFEEQYGKLAVGYGKDTLDALDQKRNP